MLANPSYYKFAPEFNSYDTFKDPAIESTFSKIKQLFEQKAGKTSDFDPFFEDENLSVRQIFLGDSQFEALFSQLNNHVEGIHYQQIPSFCSKLAQQAYCIEDPYQVWDKVEERIHESLHLFEPV